MKCAILLALVSVVAYAAAETYTDKFDGINAKEIVENHRLLEGYVKCAINKGPCTTEGLELKSHIAEALQTKCAKCTEKQKELTRYVIGYLINHEKEFWDLLCEFYDPERKYVKEYENELKELKQA